LNKKLNREISKIITQVKKQKNCFYRLLNFEFLKLIKKKQLFKNTKRHLTLYV